MPSLGTRLEQFRLENGWSKRGVAQRLGVSTPSIVRWEEGTAEPNDYNRYKIERLIARAGGAPQPTTARVESLSLFSEPPVRRSRR